MVGVWDNDGLYGTQERKPWEENRLHGHAHSGDFRHTQLWPVPAGLMSKPCMWFSHCKNPWALERHLRWVSAPFCGQCVEEEWAWSQNIWLSRLLAVWTWPSYSTLPSVVSHVWVTPTIQGFCVHFLKALYTDFRCAIVQVKWHLTQHRAL